MVVINNSIWFIQNGSELYHHGIKGQKWGVKNGPPYPLEDGNKKANSNQNSEKIKRKDSFKETAKRIVHSKTFKIAMTVAISSLALYGVYKIGKSKVTKTIIDRYRDAYHDLPKAYKSISNIPKASNDYYSDYFKSNSPDSFKKLVKGVNKDANIMTNFNRNQNCTFCSASIIARLKGYDVSAAETIHGFPDKVVEEWYKGGKFITPNAKSPSDLLSFLSKDGDGHYGTIHVKLKNGPMRHAIVYAVKNGGNVEFLDGQIQDIWSHKDLFDMIDVSQSTVMDLTNHNITEEILHALM